MNADEFNARYPVGTPVFAYPGARPEDFPKATRLVTRTRSQAAVLGGHTDVVWVDGHSACIALSHVDVVTEEEWEAAKLADAVAEQGALPVPVGDLPQAPMTPEAARVRLTQYGERTSTWSTASYDSGTERALHEIALTLLAEADHLRKERDAFRDQRNAVLKTNERLLAEVQESDQARLRAENDTRTVKRERDALQKRLHDAAMTRTWRNEDGKKFVFVEDIAPALLGRTPGTEAAR